MKVKGRGVLLVPKKLKPKQRFDFPNMKVVVDNVESK